MKWFKKFWKVHGDRLVFMALAVAFGFVFWYLMPGMKGEAKTLLVGVAMLCFNKARSNGKEKDDAETSSNSGNSGEESTG